MTDEQLRQLVLADSIKSALKFYHDHIEDCNGDDLWCCRGEECVCGGMTNREYWKSLLNIDAEKEAQP